MSLEVIEDGEQCIDCLRYGYDPHQDECLLCGRGQLRPENDDDWCDQSDDFEWSY